MKIEAKYIKKKKKKNGKKNELAKKKVKSTRGALMGISATVCRRRKTETCDWYAQEQKKTRKQTYINAKPIILIQEYKIRRARSLLARGEMINICYFFNLIKLA